jgi:hypothetical protein
MLWKRNDTYYVGYGSCCCFCRNGSGLVIYSSKSIEGPWVREAGDKNCNSSDPDAICGGYGDRSGSPLIINAQGIGMSKLPLANGGSAWIWHGDRFLSSEYNNPLCPDECQPQVAPNCAEDPRYVKGHMFDYWQVLVFNPDGSVQQFPPFTDSFTLDIATDFGTDHLPGPKKGSGAFKPRGAESFPEANRYEKTASAQLASIEAA